MSLKLLINQRYLTPLKNIQEYIDKLVKYLLY